MKIQAPYYIGVGQPPSHINATSPYDVFSLFFNKACLQILADNTNKYAELFAPKQGRRYRSWYPATLKELRAYIATWIWIGLHQDILIASF